MSELLSFECEPDKEIRIHLDRRGAEFLILTLQRLLRSEKKDHTHLMTEAWGGHELTSVNAASGTSRPYEMVSIHFWPGGKEEFEGVASIKGK